jgi:hypothetical protein
VRHTPESLCGMARILHPFVNYREQPLYEFRKPKI